VIGHAATLCREQLKLLDDPHLLVRCVEPRNLNALRLAIAQRA
jgi:hypothetical protein